MTIFVQKRPERYLLVPNLNANISLLGLILHLHGAVSVCTCVCGAHGVAGTWKFRLWSDGSH